MSPRAKSLGNQTKITAYMHAVKRRWEAPYIPIRRCRTTARMWKVEQRPLMSVRYDEVIRHQDNVNDNEDNVDVHSEDNVDVDNEDNVDVQ
nr:macro domain containing protein [Marbled eel polyomavirus]